MSITIKSNITKFLDDLQKQESEIYKSLRFELLKGVRLFESHIIRTQMSGRSGGYPGKGLNRRTGNLARSWLVSAEDTGADFIVTLGSKTIYARIHQHGGWTGRNKSTFIHKRLYILEDWKQYGANIINRQLAKGILKILK